MKWNSDSHPIAWVAASAAAAAIGAAALCTTIVGRPADGAVDFLVVGAPVGWMFVAGIAAGLAVAALHLAIVRFAANTGRRTNAIASGAYLRPLLWLALPAAGVAAAMAGVPFAPPLVYACWETAPIWMTIALVVTIVGAAAWRPTLSPGFGRGAVAVAIAALVGWILLSNATLRRQFGPVGDEPRYLRHAESWYQGHGADISRLTRMSDGRRHQPPRIFHTLAELASAAAIDSRSLVADVGAWITRRDFVWNRAQRGDGAFLVGRDGGVYQTYQPGLSLLIAPGYVFDRWTATATAFDGQFPERLYGVAAILLVLVSLTLPALAVTCGAVGEIGIVAVALAALALALLPVSSLALQVYPETAAGLAMVGVVAWLIRQPAPGGGAAWVGAAAGFLLLLHVRFLVVAVVLLGFGVWRLGGRRAVAFAAGWCGVALLQIWYVYHATGLPWPTAFYAASGISALGPYAIGVNLLRFAIDRDWGLLPHAPIFMLAIAGWVPLWTAKRDLAAIVALLVLALTATASSHTVSAAGGTPDRLIAAVVPLLAVPVAAAVHAWWGRPLFRLVFGLLATLSLAQAWDYNRSHVKEVGLMIASGVGGWRINLLFPYLSEGMTRAAAPAFAGMLAGLAALTAALLRQPRPAAGLVRPVFGTTVGVLLLMTTAGAWEGSHHRYRASDQAARAALVSAYVRAGTCQLCWSSRRGPIGPADLGANAIDRIALDATAAAGNVARFRLTASGPDGPVFGTVRFDFADGSMSAPKVMAGTLDVSHHYQADGDYTVKAWFEPPGRGTEVVSARVRVAGRKE